MLIFVAECRERQMAVQIPAIFFHGIFCIRNSLLEPGFSTGIKIIGNMQNDPMQFQILFIECR